IHEEALARLHFLVEDRRRLGLLFGPNGCGKTMTLEVFARRLRRSGAQMANVNLLGADLHEFLWLAAAELGINPDRRDDPLRVWRRCCIRLPKNRYRQLETVLLLEVADRAGPEVPDRVFRRAQVENISTAGRLTIVLAATAGATIPLASRLQELADLRID